MKVLEAVRAGLCQADEGEVLVPNPVVVPDMDNDYFVGIDSRRPARYGRVVERSDLTPDLYRMRDAASWIDASGDDSEVDEERDVDLRFLLDRIADAEVGSLFRCEYIRDADEEVWTLIEEERVRVEDLQE